MKLILLSKDKIALIDDEDYKLVSKYKWYNNYPTRWNRTSYAITNFRKRNGKRTMISMHRIIMNAKKGQEVDHINQDGLDNRKDNLRFVTKSQQSANTSKIKPETSSSKYKGVYWYKQYKKWTAQITVNDKYKGLGYFESEIDAAKAYNNAASKCFGEYAYLNIV